MHRIDHIELDIITRQSSMTNRIEEELCLLGTTGFWEPLDKVFDTLSDPDAVWSIGKLSIDLYISADGDWRSQLLQQLLQQLELYFSRHAVSSLAKITARTDTAAQQRQISSGEEVPDISILSLSQRRVEDFLFYLRAGSYPRLSDAAFYTQDYLETEFLAILRQYAGLWRDFVDEYCHLAAIVSKRLVTHCPGRLQQLLLELLLPSEAGTIWKAGDHWIRHLQKAALSLRQSHPPDMIFRQAALYEVLSRWHALPPIEQLLYEIAGKWLQVVWGDTRKEWRHLHGRIMQSFRHSMRQDIAAGPQQTVSSSLQALLASALPKTFPSAREIPEFIRETAFASPDNKPSAAGTTYDTAHAGMVLLYPYVRHFFDHLHLLDDKGSFCDETARHQAVYWWHYLASGDMELPEYACALGKILCGMPIGEPLVHRPQWRRDDLAETERLLQTFIGHWQILRDCSVPALRETFLLRRGTVEKVREEWHITVDPQAVDILLDSLPFTLSAIRMPWMDALFVVHWNHSL
ncbi:MAG TPA: contractile injection system tape measure protein [Puia sp.]|nr:contractile injection system tape measure protein [Puia sp.]